MSRAKFNLIGLSIATLALLTTACGGGGGSTGSGGSGTTSTTTTTTGTGGTGGTGGSAPVCGDGNVDAGEECDDGDKNADTGACTKACKKAACGDGFEQAGEDCDEGDKNADTGACTTSCKSASCGDGLVQSGVEECDQGAQNADTAACTSMCKSATCGDGLVLAGSEECDLGADNADTGACTKACKNASCGDGLVQAGAEDCDEGAQNADTAACTSMCKNASCGDGFVQAGVEQCDMGPQNMDTAACTSMCKNAVCGDGLVGPNEQCDLGAQNDDTGACTTMCKSASCGDGFLQMGEQCDMGAQNNDTGACTTMCKSAACGDGFVQAGVEQCDTGAQNSNTGACTLTCKTAACGDGFVQAGVEQCDLGANNSNAGACTLACKNAVCGDGFKGPNEPCDDGNMVNGDGCNTNCVVSGTPIWTQTYNSVANGADFWSAVKTDAAGNVYVTGGEPVANQNYNILVRKYDGNGAIVWTAGYNGAANGEDVGQGITLDPNGNVIVIGYETVANQGRNIWVRKYTNSGVLIWTQTFVGGVNLNADDFGYGVVTNAAGDIFISGSVHTAANTGLDILVAKLAGVNGSLVWSDVVNGAGNLDDEAIGIALDTTGAIVATGYTHAGAAKGFDTWTQKYTDNGVGFSVVWMRTTNGVANGTDFGFSVATDANNNVVVVGAETVAGQSFNSWIRKYDAAGNTVWTQTYDGAAHQSDQSFGVAIDGSGSVVVGGIETLANLTTDMWLRKYSPAGATLWTQTYNGAADGNDAVNFVTVDANANVLACGAELTAGAQGQNAWLRKYAP
jgi:cysteine-rich repeat protein